MLFSVFLGGKLSFFFECFGKIRRALEACLFGYFGDGDRGALQKQVFGTLDAEVSDIFHGSHMGVLLEYTAKMPLGKPRQLRKA